MEFMICDDDKMFLDVIENLIEKEIDKYCMDVQIIPCTSGKELLAKMECEQPDAIFLDIDMPEITGFDIAKQLEQMPIAPVIIFVSSKDHLVFESFSYQPFWFLRKSDLSQIAIVIEKLIAYVQNTKHIFSFETRKQRISVPLKDIRYFENHNHYITVHTTSTFYKYKSSIGQIAEELSAFYFVRSHVGYLLNCRYIATIGRHEIQLLSGECIPIARNRVKDVQRMFMLYTRSVHV